MCNVVAVVDRPSANRKGEIVFSEKSLKSALAGRHQVKRFAYASIDQGVYSQAEYDDFVRRHEPSSSKVKKPSWKPGDRKPCVWRVVVEYDHAKDNDRAWRWLMASEEKEIPEFSFGRSELAKNGTDVIVVGDDNAFDSALADTPKQDAVSAVSAIPIDPFAECAELTADSLLADVLGPVRSKIAALAAENLRLKEENNILRNRLVQIRNHISKDLETADCLAS